jgi:hypothetical protein
MRNSGKIRPIKKIQEEFLRLDQKRSLKVDSLKRSYDLDKYDVPGKEIAKKIINEFLLPPLPRI